MELSRVSNKGSRTSGGASSKEGVWHWVKVVLVSYKMCLRMTMIVQYAMLKNNGSVDMWHHMHWTDANPNSAPDIFCCSQCV